MTIADYLCHQGAQNFHLCLPILAVGTHKFQRDIAVTAVTANFSYLHRTHVPVGSIKPRLPPTCPPSSSHTSSVPPRLESSIDNPVPLLLNSSNIGTHHAARRPTPSSPPRIASPGSAWEPRRTLQVATQRSSLSWHPKCMMVRFHPRIRRCRTPHATFATSLVAVSDR